MQEAPERQEPDVCFEDSHFDIKKQTLTKKEDGSRKESHTSFKMRNLLYVSDEPVSKIWIRQGKCSLLSAINKTN